MVFFDTLLQRLSPGEVEAVLAHELGHFSHRHVQKRIAGIFAFSLLALALLGWLLAIGLFWFSESRTVVWAAANVAGLCMGASQSVGRALVGVLCPPAREAEIFGLWGLAVKLASILGPLSYGAVSWISGGDHRTAMLCTALFFIAGLAILASIDIERGRAARGLA